MFTQGPLVMNTHTMQLHETRQFSSFFLDYISKKDALQPFYELFPALENFEQQIKNRKFDKANREQLHKVISGQYANISPYPEREIESLLNENTFTVTTGHQLNIFSGPLYLTYKLVTTINLAKALKKKYPAYHFVPLYWMATEDHDYQEINHFHLFGKKYTWQTQQAGAVGRMHTGEVQAVLNELPEKLPLFEKAYLEQSSLADATRCWAHALFGEQGLLCLDADHPDLKAQFKEVIRKDIFDGLTYQAVTGTSNRLTKLGYEPQVNPRSINFFYLEDGLRERIVQNNDRFEVLNTKLSFTKDELNHLIETHPEKFSPNVLLRPLYQEMILPNLAYVGGPSEIVYWLQLKDLFQRLGVNFPILMPRNFALIVNKTNEKKLSKLNLSVEDLFLDENALKRKFVEKNVTHPVDVTEERKLIERTFELLVEKALELDKTLEGFVGAEKQKTINSLENIAKRLKKAEEKNQETGINQLISLKARLFPNGDLQERVDNFLNFYLNDPQFLDLLMQTFDPFDFRFQVFIDNDQS